MFDSHFRAFVVVLVVVLVALLINGFLRLRRFRKDAELDRRRHKWIYSGVQLGAKNFLADGGYIRDHMPRTRDEAMKYCAAMFPRASIMHVDDANHIITYRA